MKKAKMKKEEKRKRKKVEDVGGKLKKDFKEKTEQKTKDIKKEEQKKNDINEEKKTMRKNI